MIIQIRIVRHVGHVNQSLDYEMSVDLWSDMIAMEYPICGNEYSMAIIIARPGTGGFLQIC